MGKGGTRQSGKSASQLKRDDRGKGSKSDDRWYSHYHKSRHIIDGCFELVGYLEWWNTKSTTGKTQPIRKNVQTHATTIMEETSSLVITREEYYNLLKMIRPAKPFENILKANMIGRNIPKEYMTGKNKTQNSWLIDSGAIKHVTPHKHWLKTIKNRENAYVTIPNGQSLPIEHVGNVQFPDGFNLKDVLNVPNFKCNLISVSRLTRDLKISLTLFPDSCLIQDLRLRNLIGMGKE